MKCLHWLWAAGGVLLSLLSASTSYAECTEQSFAVLEMDDVLADCAAEVQDLTGSIWYQTLMRGVAPTASAESASSSYQSNVFAALRSLVTAVRADQALDPQWVQWFEARLNAIGPEGQNAAALVPSEASEDCDCVFVAGPIGTQMCHAKSRVASNSSTCQALPRMAATPGTLARYFAYLHATVSGVRALGADARRIQHIAFRKSLARWRELVVHGYTQFPWELYINGARQGRVPLTDAYTITDLDPQRVQLIVAHPIVGVGFQGMRVHGDPSGQAVAVLGLEMLGLLGYTPGFAHYVGGSVLVSVDNLDFADPRLGVMLHVTRFIHLGWSYALRHRDATLLMSFDLFGWAERAGTIASVDIDAPENQSPVDD